MVGLIVCIAYAVGAVTAWTVSLFTLGRQDFDGEKSSQAKDTPLNDGDDFID